MNDQPLIAPFRVFLVALLFLTTVPSFAQQTCSKLFSLDPQPFPTVSSRIFQHPVMQSFLDQHQVKPEEANAFFRRPEQRKLQEQIWSLERLLTGLRPADTDEPDVDQVFIEDQIMRRQLSRILQTEDIQETDKSSLLDDSLEELGFWDRLKACVAQQSAMETAKDFRRFRWGSLLSSQTNLTLGYVSAGGWNHFNVLDYTARSVNMGTSNWVQSHFLGSTRNLPYMKRATRLGFVQMGQNSFDILLYTFQPFQYLPGMPHAPMPTGHQIAQRLIFNSLWSLQSVPRNIMFQDFISGLQCLAKRSGMKWVQLSPALIQFGNSYLSSYLYFKSYNAYQSAYSDSH